MVFDVNYISVVVSAIVFMIVGTLWYGPFFGKQWLKLIGQTQKSEAKNQQNLSMGASMFGVFIAALVTSFVIAVVIKSLLITTVSAALIAGFMLWLGFVATTMSHRIFFEKSSSKLYFINASQSLVAILLGSLIIVLWPW
jgi:hypothetical protein